MKQERNMLIYFSGKLLPAGCTLFLMIAGVQFLGKSEYGRYNMLYNCVNIAITFCIGWIQQSMLRFNTGVEEEKTFQRNQFSLYAIACSLLASALIFILSLVYFDEPFINSFLVSLFTFTLSLFTVYQTYLQSQFRSTEYAITESAFYLVTIAVLGGIIYFSLPPQMILFFAAWLTAGVAWFIVKSLQGLKSIRSVLKSKLNSPFFKKTFQYGYLITTWLLVSSLFNVTDRFIIRHYYDYEKVGVYSAVYDFIYRLTSFATLPVLLTLHPLIMKTWNENRKKESLSLIRKAILLLSLLLIAELIGYFIFGDWIFNRFFHIDTSNLRMLTVPIIISSVLWQAAIFFHKPLELQFRQRQMIIGIILSLLSNLVMNFIFIPRYGFEVAAFTTLASTLIYILYVLITGGLLHKPIA
jgi:O-antigen/teichoic acid export membrane protein